MTSQLTFNYGNWIARYPEFGSVVNGTLAGLYWLEALLYCDTTTASPITDLGQMQILANMATAHIASLNSTTLVGRVSKATEGSVTVETDNQYPPGSVQWWQQTKYGAAFWAATTQYRMARYIPAPVRNFQPYGAGISLGQTV